MVPLLELTTMTTMVKMTTDIRVWSLSFPPLSNP